MPTDSIIIIDVNKYGLVNRQTVEPGALTLPLIDGTCADRITIRPDWPALSDPRFSAYLRAWHAAHNPGC